MPEAVRAARDWTVQDVDDSYAAIRGGGLTLLKGDIGYGLVGHSPESIEKMYRIKGRPEWNPCIVVGNLEVLRDISTLLDDAPWVEEWLREMFTFTTIAIVGPIRPDSRLLASLSEKVLAQCTKDGTVACFLNTGDFGDSLIERARSDDFALVASSANLAFQGNNYNMANIPQEIRNEVDFALDLGVSKFENVDRLGTTIVNPLTGELLRRGVNADRIEVGLRAARSRHLG
jgi:tRNA A37 threonylcarbamoyladenosine synthetase subunit TsaC/SUA5/YrdC